MMNDPPNPGPGHGQREQQRRRSRHHRHPASSPTTETRVQSFLRRHRNDPFRRILIPPLFASLFVLYLRGLLFGSDGVDRGYHAPPRDAVTIIERENASKLIHSIPLYAGKHGETSSSSSLTEPMPRSLADVVIANAEAAWKDRLHRRDIEWAREKVEEEEKRRKRMREDEEGGRRKDMAATAAANGVGLGRATYEEDDGRRVSTDSAMAATTPSPPPDRRFAVIVAPCR